MADDNIEDVSSHPFFVRADFPFVFIPTASTTGFTFANSHTHAFNNDDQTATVFINEEKNEEEEEEEEEGEVIDVEGAHKEENDDHDHKEKNNLRISQPKYSKLLKDLDFSHTRMVDVTNLLSDEAGNYLTADENENQKKQSGDEKYQSLSSDRSSVSSNEPVGNLSLSSIEQDDNDLEKAANEIQNDLNNLAAIIQQASQIPNENNVIIDTQKKIDIEEDDDTSKQVTQNYDLNDNEQEDLATSSKSNKNFRFTTQNSNDTQNDNLSSIPRLNPNPNNNIKNVDQSCEHEMTWDNLVNGSDTFIPSPTVLIFSKPINEIHTTPRQQQQPSSSEEKVKSNINPSSKQKISHRSRQSSTSSDTDFDGVHTFHHSKQKKHSISQSQSQLSINEDLNNLNTDLKDVLDQDRPYKTPSDILFRRLSNQQTDRTSPTKKKSHHRSSTSRHNGHEDNIPPTTNDNWLSVLEKLEREHKERLDKQQKQYEDYMHDLEEKMKRRFDEYLSATNSFQESKSDNADDSIQIHPTRNSPPTDSNAERYRTYSQPYQYRPLAKDLNHYPTNATSQIYTSDKRQPTGINLSRSQSREDVSTVRTELSAKHAKHVSDLKLYYEHEIDELKNQLNRSKMGHTSSTTRQSIETIERINNENIRLHDEIKDLRHNSKINEEENKSLKQQVEELRDQLNHKDLELKNYHRTISDLEQQLNEAKSIKERQDEKFRHADRQASLYREENEKITSELNHTRERLLRLEERQRELENELKTLRQPVHTNESNNQRHRELENELKTLRQPVYTNESNNQRHPVYTNENNNQRMTDDYKYSSTMALNAPTSREYGRFTMTTSRYLSSTVTSPRNGNIDSRRYISNSSDNLFRHGNSPRSITKLSDYINDVPAYSQAYVPPSRPLYPLRKPSQHIDQVPDLVDNPIKQSDLLEERFDELLRKRRDLESRINRIPTRGLSSTDRQLLDTLEREIERVEQQISSVKLELRKMNVLRPY